MAFSLYFRIIISQVTLFLVYIETQRVPELPPPCTPLPLPQWDTVVEHLIMDPIEYEKVVVLQTQSVPDLVHQDKGSRTAFFWGVYVTTIVDRMPMPRTIKWRNCIACWVQFSLDNLVVDPDMSLYLDSEFQNHWNDFRTSIEAQQWHFESIIPSGAASVIKTGTHDYITYCKDWMKDNGQLPPFVATKSVFQNVSFQNERDLSRDHLKPVIEQMVNEKKTTEGNEAKEKEQVEYALTNDFDYIKTNWEGDIIAATNELRTKIMQVLGQSWLQITANVRIKHRLFSVTRNKTVKARVPLYSPVDTTAITATGMIVVGQIKHRYKQQYADLSVEERKRVPSPNSTLWLLSVLKLIDPVCSMSIYIFFFLFSLYFRCIFFKFRGSF